MELPLDDIAFNLDGVIEAEAGKIVLQLSKRGKKVPRPRTTGLETELIRCIGFKYEHTAGSEGANNLSHNL